jgi:hypothetical protein
MFATSITAEEKITVIGEHDDFHYSSTDMWMCLYKLHFHTKRKNLLDTTDVPLSQSSNQQKSDVHII